MQEDREVIQEKNSKIKIPPLSWNLFYTGLSLPAHVTAASW